MVSRYAADIELALTKSPVVISHQFQLTLTSSTTGYIEVLVLFQNGSKLSVFEFLRYSNTAVSREKYRYQFMNSKDQEIFRYDNAPHHKSVSSFPHHKHIENKVYDSIAPSLTEVLKEAECQILGLPLK
ncbi:MAG TPA: hypothetical protein ENG83_15345 [Nitrospirae bacterium]|nr:hypothetical protein BMS3Abin06_00894 [bacterium BMS3Abin06]HDH13544.1 hypothetical protein [Nitrospirota bacterium]HDZ01016.1 hypothetical protein [Nitrospirota bacterium]